MEINTDSYDRWRTENPALEAEDVICDYCFESVPVEDTDEDFSTQTICRHCSVEMFGE